MARLNPLQSGCFSTFRLLWSETFSLLDATKGRKKETVQEKKKLVGYLLLQLLLCQPFMDIWAACRSALLDATLDYFAGFAKQFVCSPFGIVATANSVGFDAMTKETVDDVNPAFILSSNMQIGLLLSMSACHPTGTSKVLSVMQMLLLLLSLLQQLHLLWRGEVCEIIHIASICPSMGRST